MLYALSILPLVVGLPTCDRTSETCATRSHRPRPKISHPNWQEARARLLDDGVIREVAPIHKELSNALSESEFVDLLTRYGIYEFVQEAEHFLLDLGSSLAYGNDGPLNKQIVKRRMDEEMRLWSMLRTVYIHIPRTGGKVVRRRLRIAAFQIDKNETEIAREGETAKYLFASAFHDLRPETKNYTFLTVVRNPFARLVSAYVWLTKYPEDCLHCKVHAHAILQRGGNFSEFVTKGLAALVHKVDMFVPQVHYLQAPDTGEWLVPTSNIIRYENLEVELANLLANLRFKAPAANPNHTLDDRHWCGFYTAASARVVETVYADDISLLNYSFNCSRDEMGKI